MSANVDAARRELAALSERYAHLRLDRWAPVPKEIDAAIAADAALADAAQRARVGMVSDVVRRIGQFLSEPILPRYMRALLHAPRERFVLPEDIALSADDFPLALDRAGHATVSAPHAYLLTYDLLALGEGEHLLELGTGTGYGAALAREIIGRAGHVASIEIDPVLAARARVLIDLLEGDVAPRRISLFEGDASELAVTVLRAIPGPRPPLKVAVTYALPAAPEALLRALPEGARLVAPIVEADGAAEEQQLVLWEKRGGTIAESAHGAVRYVAERH